MCVWLPLRPFMFACIGASLDIIYLFKNKDSHDNNIHLNYTMCLRALLASQHTKYTSEAITW